MKEFGSNKHCLLTFFSFARLEYRNGIHDDLHDPFNDLTKNNFYGRLLSTEGIVGAGFKL